LKDRAQQVPYGSLTKDKCSIKQQQDLILDQRILSSEILENKIHGLADTLIFDLLMKKSATK